MKKNRHIGDKFSDHLKELMKDESFSVEFEKQREKTDIARLVKDARKKESISQRELAKRTGLKQSYIARLETAESSYLPRIDTLNCILEALGYKANLTLVKMKKAA